MNCTPWFDGSVKPVHVGVYERDYSDGPLDLPKTIAFALWDGVNWGFSWDTPEGAAAMTTVSGNQDLPWRGLTEPAEA